MLSPALRRAHRQLHYHREWLTLFARRTQAHRPETWSSSVSTSRQHQYVRRLSASASASSIRSNAIWRSQNRKEKAPAVVQTVPSEDLELANDFRQAIEDVNIKEVISVYPHARKIDDGVRTLTWRISQCLHEALRQHTRLPPEQRSREETEDMVSFAERLVKAIVKGDLEPDRRGHLHLLAFFKESNAHDRGIKFWTWLQEQDDQYVDLDVYGAAIELLALNGTPLPELEEIYEQALERFPASFNAYHLSPDAVVPDRNQAIEIKGLSMVLLQSIITARLLRGDSRNAYLALDVALRLYPVQTPTRIIALFIEERPVSEAYTVFAIACRAGVVPQWGTLRQLLTALRVNAHKNSHSAHIDALRQMMAAIYMYFGAGGSASSGMIVNETIIALTQILQVHDVANLKLEQKKLVVNAVLGLVRKTLETFARYGAVPGISAVNSIIVNLAGYGQAKHIIAVALNDADALGVEPNHVTRRSIVTAAGLLGDNMYVAEAWSALVESLRAQGGSPGSMDFHILVKAAKQSGCEALAESEIEAYKERLPEKIRDGVLKQLRKPSDEWRLFGGNSSLDVASLLAEMDKLGADLAVIDERTESRPTTQDFSKQSLPMIIVPLRMQHTTTEEATRELYDELTTEQAPYKSAVSPQDLVEEEGTATSSDASLQARREPAYSNTEIPFGTLRYENWKTINYLLALAEQNDEVYNRAVDEAIAAGVPPPNRLTVLRATGKQAGSYRGLSDMSDEGVNKPGNAEQIQLGRQEVLRLRGRVTAA